MRDVQYVHSHSLSLLSLSHTHSHSLLSLERIINHSQVDTHIFPFSLSSSHSPLPSHPLIYNMHTHSPIHHPYIPSPSFSASHPAHSLTPTFTHSHIHSLILSLILPHSLTPFHSLSQTSPPTLSPSHLGSWRLTRGSRPCWICYYIRTSKWHSKGKPHLCVFEINRNC